MNTNIKKENDILGIAFTSKKIEQIIQKVLIFLKVIVQAKQ
jgi:hypothetical protein